MKGLFLSDWKPETRFDAASPTQSRRLACSLLYGPRANISPQNQAMAGRFANGQAGRLPYFSGHHGGFVPLLSCGSFISRLNFSPFTICPSVVKNLLSPHVF
jgi:hypothetical protein